MPPGSLSRRSATVLATALVVLGAGASAAHANDATYYNQSPGPFCGDPQGGQAPLRLIGDRAIKYKGKKIATIRLVYSPACGTAWVKVVATGSGYFFEPSVWRQNSTGTTLHDPLINDAPPGVEWTAMIPARDQVVCGGVQAYQNYNQFVPARGKHLSWNYLGCAKPNSAQRGHPLEESAPAGAPGPSADPDVAADAGGSPPPPAPTVSETTGGVAHTWTDFASAGGSEGPTIGARQTVQIACKVSGFRVADGNTWWYRIAQAPWNNQFFVSADAFYNNGQSSGSLRGTPFVDGAVPNC